MHQYSIGIGRDVPKSDKRYSESNDLYYGNPKGNKYDINEIYAQNYISVLSLTIILLGNCPVFKLWRQGAISNKQDIEITYECAFAFYFHF